jgi:hypothetical protein
MRDTPERFDPATLAIPLDVFQLLNGRTSPPATTLTPRKSGERYMPRISEALFNRLLALPGKSLGIYLLLLQLSFLTKENPVELTNVRLAKGKVDRRCKRRALMALAGAGFIRVEKRGRNNPLVHLLDVTGKKGD